MNDAPYGAFGMRYFIIDSIILDYGNPLMQWGMVFC